MKGDKLDQLEKLYDRFADCNACSLCSGRKNIVFGRGNIDAKLMFVGEGPGEVEDTQGQPFVGPAGQLLSCLFDALDLTEDDYYITNVVKCRPPKNRNPLKEESNICVSILREQFKIMRPKIIVCLGSVATKELIDESMQITKVRGKWYERSGVLFMPTFHPAALLRDESKKVDLYIDIKNVLEKLSTIEEG